MEKKLFVIFTQWQTHRRRKYIKIRNKGTHNNNEGNLFRCSVLSNMEQMKKNVVWQRQIYSRDCKPVVLFNRKRRRARVVHCVCSENVRFHSSHGGRCARPFVHVLNADSRLNWSAYRYRSNSKLFSIAKMIGRNGKHIIHSSYFSNLNFRAQNWFQLNRFDFVSKCRVWRRLR